MEEILNIDYHVKALVLKALNGSPTVESAAGKLGVSKRTLYRYIERFNLYWHDADQIYQKTKPLRQYEHALR